MKKYTFYIALLMLTITVSAHTKYEARQYIKHSLNLTDADRITCLGINL